MSSTRLPGKVMRILGNKTVLAHVIDRAKTIPQVNAVVVATTTDPESNVIVTEATRRGAEIYRGSEHDVLARYFEAAQLFQADVVIRITSDCPLIDPGLVGDMVREYLASQETETPIDYLSNGLERTFPRGLDAEVFGFKVLEIANAEAVEKYQREHVTPFIYENPIRFRVRSYKRSVDLSRHRWTLDTPEDWEFLSAVFNALADRASITTQDVLDLLERSPALLGTNANVQQKRLGG
jgi:spore coat polysaccharide biosynthesis protein SpsF